MQTLFKRVQAVIFVAAVTASFTISSPPAKADLLTDIKKRGEFVVGTEARFPPFEFVKDGKIVGYSTDIMARVMKALPGVKLTRLDLPWQGILPGLAAAKFDYVVTSVTVTRERYEKYALSLPIADATMALVKRKGDDAIKEPEDIAGHVVGSQAGSAQLQALQAFAKRLSGAGTGVKGIKTYVDFNEAFADLAAGRISAVCNSLPNLLELVRTRPDRFELVLPTFGPKKYFSWAGRKDVKSASLVAFMNSQLAALNKSGVLTELQKKWFGGPMDLPSDTLPVPAD
ncbi:MAG: transporter substrate-binding domain-containing protein [Deltaproteobacteria bacterium]|nr:transporter substrate-binding domain-containing protein [Deltaproteobacteria bacterium]